MRAKKAKSQLRETRPDAVPEPAGPPSRAGILARRLGQSPFGYLLASMLLVTPCYWLPRLQAGDLSSHIYNSWLAQQIEAGRVSGLTIAAQSTNVLFDVLLDRLSRLGGPGAAQSIAVSLAVLVFAWGAFALVRAVSARTAWHILPCIAMLAYGWVFHMGFFNFYLGMGASFWAMALAWDGRPKRFAIAAGILAAGYLAHALPVAWAACVLAYLVIARRMEPRKRGYLVAGAIAAMVVLHAVLGATMMIAWHPSQISLATGAQQLWVFNDKYYALYMVLLAMWGWILIRLGRQSGIRQLISSLPFQVCLISAMGVIVMPTMVMIPGFKHALAYIAERMSLGVAIYFCALVAAVQPKRYEKVALAALAVLFFGFLFRDHRLLNQLEDRMEAAVAQLPPGQRVVLALADPDLQVDPLAHMIDRVCVGRCYSYANYEPSTWQFRVRATEPNPYVAAIYRDSWLLQTGRYIVQQKDLPLYQVTADETGRIITRELKAGVPCGNTYWKAIPDLFPNS